MSAVAIEKWVVLGTQIGPVAKRGDVVDDSLIGGPEKAKDLNARHKIRRATPEESTLKHVSIPGGMSRNLSLEQMNHELASENLRLKTKVSDLTEQVNSLLQLKTPEPIQTTGEGTLQELAKQNRERQVQIEKLQGDLAAKEKEVANLRQQKNK